MSAEDKGKEGGEGKTCRCPNLSGRVAFVLFTEAHVTVPMTLSHTGMVDHEEVHFEGISAGALDLIMMGPDELDNFHTAAIARSSWRHVVLWVCPVPGVVTSWVVPRIALKTVDCVSGHAVTPRS